MYVGVGVPPKFNDFRILCKPLKIKFWDLGSITIFFAVKFREDWSNPEVCSSSVAHFLDFSCISGYFCQGSTPLRLRVGRAYLPLIEQILFEMLGG